MSYRSLINIIPPSLQPAGKGSPTCICCQHPLYNKKNIKLFMQLSISNVQFIAVCKNFLRVRPFGVLLGQNWRQETGCTILRAKPP
jgi:hypothetical protein